MASERLLLPKIRRIDLVERGGVVTAVALSWLPYRRGAENGLDLALHAVAVVAASAVCASVGRIPPREITGGREQGGKKWATRSSDGGLA